MAVRTGANSLSRSKKTKSRLETFLKSNFKELTVIADVETLKHPNAVDARLQHMRALLSQLISIQIQVETGSRLVTGKTEQKMF